MERQPGGRRAARGSESRAMQRLAGRLAGASIAAGLLAACGSTGSATVSVVSPTAAATNASQPPCATVPATGVPASSPSNVVHHLILDTPAQVQAHHPFVVTVDVNYPLHIQAPTNVLIPGTGHFHLFIDRAAFPAGMHVPDIGLPGIIHTIIKRVLIPGLDPGIHTITLTLANGLDQTSVDVPPVSATIVAC